MLVLFLPNFHLSELSENFKMFKKMLLVLQILQTRKFRVLNSLARWL